MAQKLYFFLILVLFLQKLINNLAIKSVHEYSWLSLEACLVQNIFYYGKLMADSSPCPRKFQIHIAQIWKNMNPTTDTRCNEEFFVSDEGSLVVKSRTVQTEFTKTKKALFFLFKYFVDNWLSMKFTRVLLLGFILFLLRVFSLLSFRFFYSFLSF